MKCDNDECNFSYPVPKYGTIESSFEYCPKTRIPVLIVHRKNSKITFFWTDGPCFNCMMGNSCPIISELSDEYELNQNSG